MTWKNLKSTDSRKKSAANILRDLSGLGAGRGRVTNMKIRGPVLVNGTIASIAEKIGVDVPEGAAVIMDVAGDVHVPIGTYRTTMAGKAVNRRWARVLQIAGDRLFLVAELDESAARR